MDINKLSGFAPAPWEAQNGQDVIAHDGSAVRYLAQVHAGHKGERTANTRLIAAAPSLLELAKLGLELAERVLDGADPIYARTCTASHWGELVAKAILITKRSEEI